MRSTQQEARVAGFLCLLIAFIASIGLLYVPGKLIVALIAVSVTSAWCSSASTCSSWPISRSVRHSRPAGWECS
jgi:hypothetical protein